MSILITIVHVLVAVFLILVVLLQTGKRADLAGAFGGGGSQTAFGTRGAATLLSKLTTGAAVMFMLTSLSLSILSSSGPGTGEGRLQQLEGTGQTDTLEPSEAPADLPALPPVDADPAAGGQDLPPLDDPSTDEPGTSEPGTSDPEGGN